MTKRSLSFPMLVLALGFGLLWIQDVRALNPNHDCLFCHSLHNAPGQGLLNATVVEDLCLTCHGPAGTSTLKADVHTNKTGTSYAAFTMTCIDCHSPHSDMANWLGGTNVKLVGTKQDSSGEAKINTPNSGIREVVFESSGTDAGGPSLHSFADNDEDGNGYWDGVCETCHTQANNHRNNSSGNHAHNAGLNCTTCHPHDAGFLATGGACTDCHNSPQDNGDGVPAEGRRAVTEDFGQASHHLQGASINNADCEVCHEMGQHQQGYVRLKDVDDPGNPAAVVTLLDDPSANSTEAEKLAPFCLACHDADGASGFVPFTDGATPPVIDDAIWASASHNAVGSLTCFGDGQIFGCHGSGHGSDKRKLLAPPNGAPTPPENAEEEEGFCFGCHDSDGPASGDIQSQFATAVRWVDDGAGPNDNWNLNDRHDVQYSDQSVSGAKLECTDCHDPHTATQTNPLKSDPDTADGRVPGTGQVLAGADFQTEWCLDCHDGSFPALVTAPSTTLTDIRNAYSSLDAHGLIAGQATLRTGYGWTDNDFVPCLACHSPHPGTARRNLFQAKDTILSKDETTPIPSDVGPNYELTTLTARHSNLVNGYGLCNTCHTGSMGSGKKNCFTCHFHSNKF